MKKIVSFAAALTLMGSMAAAAGAEEAVTGTTTPTSSEATTSPAIEVNAPVVETIQGTVETAPGSQTASEESEGVTGQTAEGTTTEASTSTTDKMFDEPLVKPGDEVQAPTMLLKLLERTWFYDAPNGKPIGALGTQIVDTTGEVVNGFDGGEWVQIYTWKGKGWIHVSIQ
ncbi:MULTISPECIES: hypothetical protein [Paenibacillus]|uniref:hypothetical protein n=1 Tax=Paenibacillus TaxID=44249 RepID=UPI001F453595|nr:hypothetical protein [Paenibacillus sp. JJ-223]CAH1221123.1 hypothetical protein PAECIP111890_05204 [Paenibacillus sp. JJ-223]